MSKIEVDAIDKQSGSTLTLGGSGTAVTLACGATQSGFGRTGTVDWQTGSIKTSTFTAANGEGYFVDTSSGAVTANLPAGSAGAIVSFSDYTRTFGTNALTINPNGSEKIGGVADDAILDVNGQAITLVYVDATEGWINIQNAEDTETGLVPGFIAATGGTITTVCTNFKVHTFTGPGTFSVTSAGNARGSNTVDYMVVAGGGSGGNANSGLNGQAGGAGAGGYRESSGTVSGCYTVSPLGACVSALPVTATSFPITVGAGGAARSSQANGNPGSNSVFSTITSAGGGGGGKTAAGCSGGSGGGAACGEAVGAGNTPPVSPPQGNPGGLTAGSSNCMVSGGGGGAIQAGQQGTASSGPAGPGGNGATSSINGTPTTRAGGGAGGGNSGQTAGGTGGSGGGGAGGNFPVGNGTAGTTNTGGGGGASSSGPGSATSGAGGSGIVIIRYKFQ